MQPGTKIFRIDFYTWFSSWDSKAHHQNNCKRKDSIVANKKTIWPLSEVAGRGKHCPWWWQDRVY